MKKQYINPQCEYWCYVSGQLCSVGDALYGVVRRSNGNGDAGHTDGDFPIMNPGSNKN